MPDARAKLDRNYSSYNSLRTKARRRGGAAEPGAAGLLLGSHLSVAGGAENALVEAARLGCDCLQIFVKNQRQWRARPLTDEQAERFHATRRETRVGPVVAHASYLLNLASPDGTMRRKSVRALIDELQRCETLKLDGLIFHPGAHLDGTLEQGIRRIARGLDQVQRACGGFNTRVLLETTAGQGTSVGYRFEQLAGIFDETAEPERLGVCLDTCHLFAAGYDFRKPDGYAEMIDRLDGAFGVARVECIHVNDSKREAGSRVDRHEHIGKGKIGKAGFVHFVNDPRWQGVPMILETPKGKDGRGADLDKVNMKRLRGWARRN